MLKSALPPVGEQPLPRDLWPDLLRRMERPEPHADWWDWALAALAVTWLLMFPDAIGGLLYHL
jgi:hypothetical protein